MARSTHRRAGSAYIVAPMATEVESDIRVQRFAYVGDERGRRLRFPHAEAKKVEGRSGSVSYGAGELVLDGLEGRLGGAVRWAADSASLGAAWLRDDAGRVDMKVDRIELAHGLRLTRAEHGIELVAPHVTLSEVRLTLKGPFGRAATERAAAARAPTAPAAPPPPAAPNQLLRQDRLRFLDSLTGRIYFTMKVVLDLPVLGVRSLDQVLRIPIQEGSLDYRALDEGLDWLEGAFLDMKHDGPKLAVTWKVPIFGSSRDLLVWTLDDEAATLAAFGRVPVRSLADYRVAARRGGADDKKRKTLQALSLDKIDVALSLVAPRSLEVGGGLVMFGGDDSPGMVDLQVTGAINDKRPGALHGRIGSIDTTFKDVHIGSSVLTADRLHFDGLEELAVEFDGFRPVNVDVIIHRVTATNLSLQLGKRPAPPTS